MKKKRVKPEDPRLQTPPGHYLKNAPWRKEFVEEVDGRMISSRDGIVILFLVVTSAVVAASLWMNPPKSIRFDQANHQAIQAQATLAGNRMPRAYNGLGYDPAKFEEVKEDDPIVQDDLENVLPEDVAEEKPAESL